MILLINGKFVTKNKTATRDKFILETSYTGKNE